MSAPTFRPSTLRGLAEMAAVVSTAPLSRRWFNAWGATPDERRRALPGDEIVPVPRLAYTRAVTIAARAEVVWPWLLQIGQGRGGLYSYDGLENLVGCDIHSAEVVLSEHQRLSPGDEILFGPAEKGFPGQVVLAVDPPRSLVMCALDPKTRSAERSATWVFHLEERRGAGGASETRLLVRGRNAHAAGLGPHLMWRIVEPIAFVMERRMLLGIKARAERAP